MSLANSSLTILLVENHTDTLLYLQEYLVQEGHEVHIALNMQMALKKIESISADILISDIALPDGDGWELMQRATTMGRHFFSVAISGYDLPEDREKSRAAGFHHHLTKPFLPEDLEALLKEAAKSIRQ